MPETTPETAKSEPIALPQETIFPTEGTSTLDFECTPWIDKKAGKKDSKVTKPKDMPQKDWEKQFENGYLKSNA